MQNNSRIISGEFSVRIFLGCHQRKPSSITSSFVKRCAHSSLPFMDVVISGRPTVSSSNLSFLEGIFRWLKNDPMALFCPSQFQFGVAL